MLKSQIMLQIVINNSVRRRV